MLPQPNSYKDDDIAIIGMSGVFPGADDLEEFWSNLVSGTDHIGEFPAARKDELINVIPDVRDRDFMKSGYLGQVAQFEPELFSISHEECRFIDPQQRLLIELVEEAILNAGYDPVQLAEHHVGLYFSSNLNSYTDKIATDSAMKFLNGIPSMSAGRIAYIYNFHGPALTFDAACSSSLVAFHYAIQSLRAEEADIAITGGTSLTILPEEKKDIHKQSVLSQEQKVRAFDKKADGTVAGEGGGIVILKLLKKALYDGDTIHAIVKGSAVNSNGSRSNGVAAPSERGQAEVIKKSIKNARIDPLSLSYIETHGTGTKIGDPIEIAAVTKALDELGYRRQYVAVGSVKSNIGHLDSAAGIASLLKAVLSLKYKQIPASINFEAPNPLIDFENSPVYVNDVLADWSADKVRRAGVTSLGLIGTNCFAILEEAPEPNDALSAGHDNVVMLSARTASSLEKMAAKLLRYLERHRDLNIDHISFTLNTGRRNLSHKIGFAAQSTEELLDGLQAFLTKRDNHRPFEINNKSAFNAIYILPDMEDAEIQSFGQLYTKHPQFRRWVQWGKARITNESDLQDPNVMYLLHMYAYVKLAEAYSIPIKAVLGMGKGDLVADLVTGKKSFEETLQRVKLYNQPKKAIEGEKLKALGAQLLKAGIHTVVTFCFKPELFAAFEQAFCQLSGIVLWNLNQQSRSFTHTVISLVRSGLEINWNKVYEGEGRKRVSLPGYVFHKAHYFIQPGELNLPIQGNSPIEAVETAEAEERTGLSVRENLLHMFGEVYHKQDFTLSDSTANLALDSIMIMQFAGKVKKVYGVDVPLSLFFGDNRLGEVFDSIEGSIGSLTSSANKIMKQPEREYYPASSPQKRVYILNQLANDHTSYNMPGAMIINGVVNRTAFEQAFQTLIERHESLRTTFEFVDNGLVQRIHPGFQFHMDYLEAEEDGVQRVIHDFVKPFDVSRLPLLRVALVRLEPDKHLFLFDIHHIVSDGLSMGILIEELIQLYEGAPLQELSIQYKDFAVWQAEWMQLEDFHKQEQHWLQVFAAEAPVLALPTDYQRPPVQSFEGDSWKFEASPEIALRLFEMASQEGTTLNMLLLAAYNVLMYKYTGQEDIVVGTPIAGRRHADLDNVIGMFVNTLAMRNYPAGSKTFRTFLNEVKEHAAQAIDNQDYQFEDLIEKLDLKRNQSRNPLFDTMFVLQNMHSGQADSGSLRFEPYLLGSKVSKFDLNMTASNNEKHIYFDLEYCTKLFKEETIKRMAGHYLKILTEITENPLIELDRIDMLSADEKKMLLESFNRTESDYEKDKTIHRMFEEQAKKSPERVAVVFANQSLTYGELNSKANLLAQELRHRGVGRDSIVGLMTERSLEMMVGLLGILKSGAAYLPIDPQYPKERVEYMLDDSGTRVLLTQGNRVSLPHFHGDRIDLQQAELWRRESKDIPDVNGPDDLAYILYTSGSTGKPKGVMIEHKAVMNFMKGTAEQIDFSANKTVLCLTTISFDIFVLETLLPLTRGLRVVVADEHQQVDPMLLGQLIISNQVDMLQTTPSRLQMLLSDSEGFESLQRLKEIMVGGEAFPETLLAKMRKLKTTRIYNMYGPTETTVWSAVKDMTDAESISIGKPISNTRLYIVDKNNRMQPVGVPGELCIAGDSLARGYLNRPDLTSEKFVPNPFEPGHKMYKTGDMARWLPDGNVEFIGRADNQVKIRGYRIEPSEVESCILQCDMIKEAVVVAREDASSNKYLGAYYTASEPVAPAVIRQYLSKELPEYMIPSYYMQLERMPLTPNGKLDRKQLPPFEANVSSTAEYMPPETETEGKLAAIWQEMLGLQQISINDNFFEIGGHSLKAALFIARVNKEFGFQIPLREIFKQPTIRNIAGLIDSCNDRVQSPILLAGDRAYYPVPQQVQEVIRHSLARDTGTLYNKTLVTIIEGLLDRPRLEYAFGKLIQRHEILRTSFDIKDGVPKQVVHKEVQLPITEIVPITMEIDDAINDFVRPFKLDQAPFIRAGLMEMDTDKHVFILDMHQTITDGTSGNILVAEMLTLYTDVELEELPLQYKDYSVWLAEQSGSEEMKVKERFWLDKFAGELPAFDFPTDYVRPAIQSLEGSRLKFVLDKELIYDLKQFSADSGATLFMTLFAAYNILMHKYTKQEDLVIGTSVAARPHSDLQKVIGSFTNSLAMRNYPKPQLSIMQFIDSVKENTLSAFENHEYRYADLVDKLKLRGDASRNPLYTTMFVLHNMEITEAQMGNMTFTPYEQEKCMTKYDFIWHAHEAEDEIRVDLMYSAGLFRRETIHRLSQDYISVLKQMIRNPNAAICDVSVVGFQIMTT
ncbi:amino acid adenylation domain-containing protein [Paenibacillus forsythiae]|uniref:Amino acid adenylation domain-containing protein n=1 Tax=Paenibacillus forsythiae TaxID=365616 RepID=A0ABU3H4R3_9BACL|nr:non-ribosomal peptide synthetase [Paenibacillus forsythiae]MDT3425818.1 amino acid adenylation domain-containing protein [Paenibacillus forsythiae]